MPSDVICPSSFYYVLDLMMLYHVMYHVTTVMCLFIIQKEKEKRTKRKEIESRKIDKRKRKLR